ncbi:helix-turn-helix domain-containing protein [Ralstonia sp. 25C]|uniref:helix-turn-helix domain-containing protein n=1 Tax=Ralstonia sp. 25C TaxID=3447363 RepID=UPI003F750515
MNVTIPPGLAAVAGTRDVITTAEAAAILNFKENTLRKWSCHERGPIRPVHINGRLGWKVTDIAELLAHGER